ncbi:unnamed protein product [Soboliphyme baturini]|uniref:proteasome endopeptidase complex n=1 Tax=Soboliphyme baturini TaxID=241478 RepID=A0A183IYU0_9BILA|nr:unnamed protein product [Soboliphyme baturini]
MALASISGYDKVFRDELSCPLQGEELLSKEGFPLSPFLDAKGFVNAHFGMTDKGNDRSKLHFYKGTTTLSFIYTGLTENDKGGIIMAADSRATSGEFIASSTVKKILEVTDHIMGTLAGGAADCQFWLRVLSKHCRLFELQNKEKVTVSAASKLLQNVLYSYKGMGLSFCNCNFRGSYLPDSIKSGLRIKGEMFSCGSGSLNAYGILDTFYKPKMTDEEAYNLGRKAIMHATYRDIGSGGFCNLFHITESGWYSVGMQDASEMSYEFLKSIEYKPIF